MTPTPLIVMRGGYKSRHGRLRGHHRDRLTARMGSGPADRAYVYAQNRKSEQPLARLAGFTDVVQVDG